MPSWRATRYLSGRSLAAQILRASNGGAELWQNGTPATASRRWWAGGWYLCHPLGRIFFSRPGSRPLYLPSTAHWLDSVVCKKTTVVNTIGRSRDASRPRYQQGGNPCAAGCKSGLLVCGVRECSSTRGCANAHCSIAGIIAKKRRRRGGN